MVERQEIVKKCQEYLSHCLGIGDNQTLLIATTPEEWEVANLFLDARKQGKLAAVYQSSRIAPHTVVQNEFGNVLAVRYELQRGTGLKIEDGNLDNWKSLVKEYEAKHAVGFIDRQPGELPWRIAFMGINSVLGMTYGHGPGTTMDHMRGHFMIDYHSAAQFGSRLGAKLMAPDVVGYLVKTEKGTNYVVFRDAETHWHNDLMPRPFLKDGVLVGDAGNVPGGEIFDEVSYNRPIQIGDTLISKFPTMKLRPAFGLWVGDLSVGSAKKSLKDSGAIAKCYVGVNPTTMEVLVGQAGRITGWDCTDQEVKSLMREEISGDPFVATEGLIMQESLAFGFNPKANPATDDLLEGEKAPALHAGFGGVLSHIDLLASLDGAEVYLVRHPSARRLEEKDAASLIGREVPSDLTLEKLVDKGKYLF